MKRVLIVDDEPEICEALIDLLSPQYAIDAASNGADALHAVRASRPDLVIADFKMPGVDGISFVEQVVHDERHADIKFILMSGFLEDMVLAEWKKTLGNTAVRCFQKPLDMKNIEEAVKTLLDT